MSWEAMRRSETGLSLAWVVAGWAELRRVSDTSVRHVSLVSDMRLRLASCFCLGGKFSIVGQSDCAGWRVLLTGWALLRILVPKSIDLCRPCQVLPGGCT